jgi:hypothetical protein
MVEILDRLKSLEGKVDNLSLRGLFSPTAYGPVQASIISGQESLLVEGESPESLPAVPLHPKVTPGTTATRRGPYRYVSAVQKMLAWPVVQQVLESTGSKRPFGPDSASIVLGMQGIDQPLPNDGVESLSLNPRTSVGTLQLQVPASSTSLPLSPSSLNWETMQRLSKAYFDTFNFLYPIMDREAFNANILTAVMSDGFDDGTTGILACLVFALGDVAIAGTQGIPIGVYKGRPSGIKGGSVDRPPGLAFFNEARRRMGFSLTDCSIENVETFALAG